MSGKLTKPDVIYASVVGGSNVAFYKQLKAAGIDLSKQTLLTISVTEDEIDGIASGTRFNDESLLDGSTNWSSGVNFRVGTTSSDNITVQIAGVTTTGLGINTLDVGTSATAAAALTALDTAVTTLSDARADVGALISRFEFRSDMIDTTIENTEAAQSAIMDVDVAEEQSKLASEKVLTQAAIAVLSQANQMPENLLSLLR